MKKKLKGSLSRPRLYIFKSNRHLYAQIIDDENHKILASSSTISENIHYINCKIAKRIGQKIAQQLKDKGIQKIIFDRGKNVYHGKIKALADATREAGILF